MIDATQMKAHGTVSGQGWKKRVCTPDQRPHGRVLEEVSDWQNRALEPIYPIVLLDALHVKTGVNIRVKIRDAKSRQVKNKAVYVAPGANAEGEREVPGLWIAANEGAKF